VLIGKGNSFWGLIVGYKIIKLCWQIVIILVRNFNL
jgi:hypothetical protein